jgi:hypothetical protein
MGDVIIEPGDIDGLGGPGNDPRNKIRREEPEAPDKVKGKPPAPANTGTGYHPTAPENDPKKGKGGTTPNRN